MYKLILLATIIGIAFSAVPRYPLRDYKIVGGEPADISKYPWQIGLENDRGFCCAGFLISDSWALTAAHCTDIYDIKNIRAGSSLIGRGGEVVPVEKSIIHPDFDYHEKLNDISLIKLSQPVTALNGTPATLPASGEAVKDDALATLIGWGTTKENGEDFSEQLLQVQVRIANHDVCTKAYDKYEYEITENMICTGLLGVGGKSSCQGDAGGPVEVDGKAVGIVSYGLGCAEPDYPYINTKVSNFIDWIKKETGLNL